MSIPPSAAVPPSPGATQNSSPKKNGLQGGLLALFICSVGLFLGLRSFWWPEHVREKLIREGLPAEAVVLDADPTGNTYNSQPEIRLKLRVTLPEGESYEAETEMIINPIYAPQFQPGKRLKVRYSKEDRSEVVVEETENGQR